jgi:hypothetical protein
MAAIKEALLRNCLIGRIGDYNVKIAENYGNITFTWSNGKTTRLRRSANGVDSLIELPDGSDLRISLAGLF